MNQINIKRSNYLYRFFEMLTHTGFYSYIHYDDDGNINSFNDVCTFVKHIIRIIFESFCILLFFGFLLIAFLAILGTFLYGMFYGAETIYKQEWSSTITSFIVFPLIFYIMYNKIFISVEKNETAIGKLVEIVAAKKSNMCVKINVVDDDHE